MSFASPYLDWLARELGEREIPPGPAFAAASRHVIGYATGYGVGHIAPFVRSLRANYDGFATLVVDDDPSVHAFLRSHGVLAVPEPARDAAWSPHVVVSRLAGYERLLRGARHDAAVLLTDVRDVVFQGDPLSPPPDRIEAFDELDGEPFASHALNRKYTRALTSQRMVDLLADCAALCVGTVAGPAAALARLCRVMLMLCARPRSGMGGAFGADQAAFNLALHLGLVEAEVRPNFSRVATLGVPAPDRLAVRDGVIVNPDGSVSPIVHQYDRHPAFFDAVQARLGGGEAVPPRCQAITPARWLERHRDSLLKRIPELR